MPFDVQGARAAGYSDTEIADHMAQASNFNVKQARASGYSDAEIIDHLASKPPKLAGPPTGDERALHEARLKKAEDELAERTGVGRAIKDFAGDVLEFGKGAGDMVGSIGSQAILTPIAGLTGAAVAPFAGSDKAADVTR